MRYQSSYRADQAGGELLDASVLSVGLEVEPDFVASSAAPRVSRPSVELLALIGIAVVAFGLRFAALGMRPLSDAEAGQALSAWNLYRGQPPDQPGYSPLLTTLNLAGFALFGDSDATARLCSALLGVLLVLLPYGLRRQLGSGGVLAAAALLAVSPTVLYLSRIANGDIGAAAGGLALVAGLYNWFEAACAPVDATGRPARGLALAAAGLVLMLTASPASYSILLLLVLFGAALFVANRRGAAGERASIPGVGAGWKSFGLILLAGTGVTATGFLLNLGGLGAMFDQFARWVGGFVPGAGAASAVGEASYPAIFLITLYEPLLLVAGIFGMSFAIARRRPVDWWLAWWFLGGIVLDLLRPGRGSGDVLVPLVPLALLAGLALGRLGQALRHEASWTREGIVAAAGLVICTYAYVELMIYTLSGGSVLWLPLAAIGMLAAVLVLFRFWYDGATAMRGAAITLVAVLAIFGVGSAVRLNYSGLADARQPLVRAPAAEGLPLLVSTLKEVSSRAADDPYLVQVIYDRTLGPSLEWQLRRFNNAVGVDGIAPDEPLSGISQDDPGPPARQGPPIIISSSPFQSSTDSYAGESFGIRAHWAPVNLDGPALIRWLVLRVSSTLPSVDRVILWVRQGAANK